MPERACAAMRISVIMRDTTCQLLLLAAQTNALRYQSEIVTNVQRVSFASGAND
jgi:hypothetical protein